MSAHKDENIHAAVDYIEALYRSDEREYAASYLEFWLRANDRERAPQPNTYGVPEQSGETIRNHIRALVATGKKEIDE